MKVISLVRYTAVVCAAVMPIFAHAADEELVQGCVKSFIAEKFPDRVTTVRVEREYEMNSPLVLRASPQVKLVATEKVSGRVVATAMCNSKSGVVTVLPITTVDKST